MFVKNKSILIELGRSQEEREHIETIVNLADFILNEAQPEKILSKAVIFSNNVIKINSEIYNLNNYRNFYLISFGKASQKMSKWFINQFPMKFSRIIIVSPDVCDNYFKSYDYLKFFKGGHPKPNTQSSEAATEVISLLEKTTKDDLCIFLISGGGSALLEQPDYDIPFADYEKLVEILLSSNASIQEINTLRKHFSKIKGGKLVQKTESSILSIIISDVLGNDISSIASGPSAPDRTTWNDCAQIISFYSLMHLIPNSITDILRKGLNSEIPDTPSETKLFRHVHNHIIGDNKKLIQDINQYLSSKGITEIIDNSISGESQDVGKKLAQITSQKIASFKEEILSKDSSVLYLIFGGETTVTLKFLEGKGGRNQELALCFALSLTNNKSVYLLSLGTDGIDGNSEAAGAIVCPSTVDKAHKIQEAKTALERNNTNSFFQKYGGEIITGYTGTNLMDIGVIICFVEKNS